MNWVTLAYTISAHIIVQMIFLRNQSVPFSTYYIVLLTVHQLKNITRVTPTGIEPVLPPWKGDVLTAWPRSLILFLFLIRKNSPSRARTYNNSVNSRVLYHWAIEDHSRYLCKCTCIWFYVGCLHTSIKSYAWISGAAATERLCLEVTYIIPYKNKGLYLQNRYRTISIFFPS